MGMINGPLVRAGLELLSTDPSDPWEGRVYGNTTAYVLRIYLNSGWHSLCSLDQTQTLLNKTLASPSITTAALFANQAIARFYEQTGNGTNYIGLTAPDSVASDLTFKLPGADGSANQVLQTDGSGNLSFATVATISNNEYSSVSANYTITDADNVRFLRVTAGSSSFTFSDGDVSTGDDSITETSHGLSDGDVVHLSTTGTLPTGLEPYKTYFVVSSTVNTIDLSETPGGSSVDITAASGGGTHTVHVGVRINLPTAADNEHRPLTITKDDATANKVVVVPESSEQINAVDFITLSRLDQTVSVTSDASDWYSFSATDTSKFRTRYLSGDATADATLSDLTFATEVGKVYRATWQFYFIVNNSGASDAAVECLVSHNSATIARGRLSNAPGGEENHQIAGGSITFRATATSLTFVSSSCSTNSRIQGAGNGTETWAQIEELPFHTEGGG